jgi:murein DD-endopeptidase MepM/ murein hydrolase activator NlpD
MASGFGGRAGRQHNGIDILAPEGTPVRASEAGVVAYAGDGLRGFGIAAVLDHGGGASTLYGHLREIHVKSGDVVAAGSVIGAVGRTGNATTPHLHFELRLEGRPVDPADYLQRMDETP